MIYRIMNGNMALSTLNILLRYSRARDADVTDDALTDDESGVNKR